jgi:hypothetical protein
VTLETRTITLQFVGADGLSSEAIEWFSHGAFSHVDSVLDDETLLGARADVIGGIPAGVQIRPPGYETFKRVLRVELVAPADIVATYYEFVRSQLGKPYDKESILAFVTGRDWREPDSWFCSELVARALEVSGYFLFPLASPANKVTPSELVQILSICVPITLPAA